MSILNQLTDEEEMFEIKIQITHSQYHLDKLKIELESMLNLIRSNNETLYYYKFRWDSCLPQIDSANSIKFLEDQNTRVKVIIQDIRLQMVKLRLEIIELQIGLL
jgi:hypothetical protein